MSRFWDDPELIDRASNRIERIIVVLCLAVMAVCLWFGAMVAVVAYWFIVGIIHAVRWCAREITGGENGSEE